MPLQMDTGWKINSLKLEPSVSEANNFYKPHHAPFASMGTSSQRGYTFIEMVMVVALVAIFAVIAVPSMTSANHEKLKLAGSNIADAVRFAREESRRTHIIYGVAVDTANNQLRVFQLDETPDPNLKVFDVYQPISKHLYTVQLNAPPYSGVEISSLTGQMVGTCDETGNIAFDAMGVVRCIDPLNTRMTDAKITLSLGGLTLDVLVDSYTGRVLVQ